MLLMQMMMQLLHLDNEIMTYLYVRTFVSHSSWPKKLFPYSLKVLMFAGGSKENIGKKRVSSTS